MPAVLPPELFDNIFFNLRASSDFASLYAFTELNDVFRSLAEPHLYYHLTLSDHDPYDTSPLVLSAKSVSTGHSPSQILRLLSDKPHIAIGGYVRSLKVLIETLMKPGLTMDDRTRRLWDEDTARVLPLLTSLERVAMSQMGMGRHTWRYFNANLQLAFENMLSIPSIREVEMCDLEFPLQVLYRSATLKKLELSGANVGRVTQDQELSCPTRNGQRGALSSLILKSIHYPIFVSWLDSETSPDISGLRYLTATLQKATDFQHIASMLSPCSSSLETLTIDAQTTINLQYRLVARDQDIVMPGPVVRPYVLETLPELPFSSASSSLPSADGASQSSPFSLACLSSLRQLRLCLEMWGFGALGGVYSAPFEFLRRFLGEIQANPPRQRRSLSDSRQQIGDSDPGYSRVRLERLVLDIKFNFSIMDFLGQISWRPVASALSTFSEAMPSLEVVEITVILFGPSDENEQIGGHLKEAVQILQADEHLAPLIATELVRISGKRLDRWTGELVDMV